MINHLILVGCGHMGGAMLRRWIDANAASHIYVVDQAVQNVKQLLSERVQGFVSVDDLPADLAPDVIMFAVRPQIMAEVAPLYKRFDEALFLSVAAGLKLEFYTRALGAGARVIRVMPNLAAKMGEGATLLIKNHHATRPDMAIADKLIGELGINAWLEREELMDIGTALSGCGPAYFYMLADYMAEAAAKAGLPMELAQELAKQTMIGAATLWKDDATSAQQLYTNIAIKGGMTEAALNAFKKNDAFKKLVDDAMQAAANRGKELAK